MLKTSLKLITLLVTGKSVICMYSGLIKEMCITKMILRWIFSDNMIGCFKTPSGLFSETLANFTHEADPDQALMECGELAHNKNYSVFALGFRGLCLSGPDAQDKYYQRNPASKRTKCSNGIGLGPHSVVYSLGMDDFSSCFMSYTCACRFLAMVWKQRNKF